MSRIQATASYAEEPYLDRLDRVEKETLEMIQKLAGELNQHIEKGDLTSEMFDEYKRAQDQILEYFIKNTRLSPG